MNLIRVFLLCLVFTFLSCSEENYDDSTLRAEMDSLELRFRDSLNALKDSLNNLYGEIDSINNIISANTVDVEPIPNIKVYKPKEKSFLGTYTDNFEVWSSFERLKNFVKSNHVKIAFREDESERLYYQEIYGDSSTIQILDIDITAYHPQFSPDGSKLAFSTAYEGSYNKASELYVIDLNTKTPLKLNKLEVESAGIPRWKVLDNGDTVINYVDYTGTNINEKWNTSATYRVKYSNNKFGTPEKIFDRAYNGGISKDYSFAVSGAPVFVLRHKSDTITIGEIFYNGEQVCNVSLSRFNDNKISFLDATGFTGKQFVGKKYQWHEYIFIVDTLGTLQSAIKCFAGYVFDGVEWINIPDVLVGSLSNLNSQISLDIAIINTETDERIVITHSKDESLTLKYPDVWVDNSNY